MRRGGIAGGGLDVVCARLGNDLGDLCSLVGVKLAGLDDDLKELAVAGGLDSLDLVQNVVIFLVLHPADVDDHVDFVGTVLNCVLGLENLGGGGVGAVGKPITVQMGSLSPTYSLACFT